MRLSIIVAMAKNRAIGKDNRLLWRIPPDLQHFKNLTRKQTVIMGRKTFDSLDRSVRPLPDRRNIVLTRDKRLIAGGCEMADSFEQALSLCTADDEVFVIGGQTVYAQALPLANKIYLTLVDVEPEADRFFPVYDESEWQAVSTEDHQATPNYPAFSFIEYERRTPSLVDPRSAKSEEYRNVLEEILAQGVCPFCPEHMNWHPHPILWQNLGWRLTEIAFPYEGSEQHYLLIPDRHLESLTDLRAEDWMTIGDAGRWLTTYRAVSGGALALRFGDPQLTGATVKHLHCHLIVPRSGQVVNFPIG